MPTLRSPILNVGWDVDDDVGVDVDGFPVDGDIADGFADVGFDDGFGKVGFDVDGVLVDEVIIGFDKGFADVGFDEGFVGVGFDVVFVYSTCAELSLWLFLHLSGYHLVF